MPKARHLGGSGGMVPRENFLILCLKWWFFFHIIYNGKVILSCENKSQILHLNGREDCQQAETDEFMHIMAGCVLRTDV